MARKTTTIRIDLRTKRRLEALKKKIYEEQGIHLTIDGVINYLLNECGAPAATGAPEPPSHQLGQVSKDGREER